MSRPEKLTIEHLAPYLPYELKVGASNDYNELVIRELRCDWINTVICTGEWKPLVRPLSYLTKEITVEGDTFVPVEWFEIGDGENDLFDYDYGNSKLIRDLESISQFGIHHDINFLPYAVVKKLHEWHFDTQGLIDAGLAIDVNTI